MIALLQEYWPLLVVLAVVLLAMWGVGYLEWNRGFDAGQEDAVRQLDKARRSGRL